jgi:hypothetical protein
MGGGTKATARSVNVHGYGKLSLAAKDDVPLLWVFGGIPVGGQASGVYMWNYMNALKDRYHIFVANSNHTPGTLAYGAVMKRLAMDDIDITPDEEILYLFSGGYAPGQQILYTQGSPTFSEIFLVDIWMHAKVVADFYKFQADVNAGKMYYVYTTGGAVNEKARDYIADRLGASRATHVPYRKGVDHMDTHMSTNKVAVSNL